MRRHSITLLLSGLLASLCWGCGNGGGEQVEDEPFQVTGTAPADLEVGVPIETNVRAQLNADIDRASLDTSTFTLFELDGAQVSGSVEVSESPSIAVFTPDAPLTLSARYQATITTGLRDVDSRALEAPLRWSFTARDPGWGVPEFISRPELGLLAGPQVGVDAANNAFCVWEQFGGARFGIWANRYTATGGWGAAAPIDPDETIDATDPQLAVASDGVAHAVWAQLGGAFNIFSSRYLPGEGWGTPELIQTGEVTEATSPQIAVDGNGNAVAVWMQRDLGRTGRVAWANRYTASGWGDAELVDSAAPGIRDRLMDLAVDGNGNAVAVWTGGAPAREDVWSNRYTVGDGWGIAERIETEELSSASSPQVASAPDGTTHVVWQQRDDIIQNIWTNSYTPAEGWGSAQILETEVGAASAPAIAVDPAGVAHAVWAQSDGTLTNIWTARNRPGDGWGAAELIEMPIAEPNEEGSAGKPRVSVDPNGNAFAVWEQATPVGLNVWSNRYTPTDGWGIAERIEQETFFASRPQVAVDLGGQAHAVWEQSDGDRLHISTNRFQ